MSCVLSCELSCVLLLHVLSCVLSWVCGCSGAAKDRRIKILEDEIKSLKKAVRTQDKVIESMTDELEEIKLRPDNSLQLQNDIKMLSHSIEELTAENKTLGRLETEKSAVIEDLSLQLEDVEDNSHEVANTAALDQIPVLRLWGRANGTRQPS